MSGQDQLFFEFVGFVTVFGFVLINERRRLIFLLWLILWSNVASDLRHDPPGGGGAYALDSVHGVVVALVVWVFFLLVGNMLAYFNYPVKWSGFQQ